jgi:DNA gyrase subunit A
MVDLRLVAPDDQLMVITDAGQVIRTRVNEIRVTGRNAQGVRIIRLGDGEHVVDVERVAPDDEAGAARRSNAPPSLSELDGPKDDGPDGGTNGTDGGSNGHGGDGGNGAA